MSIVYVMKNSLVFQHLDGYSSALKYTSESSSESYSLVFFKMYLQKSSMLRKRAWSEKNVIKIKCVQKNEWLFLKNRIR